MFYSIHINMMQTLNVHCFNHKQQNAAYFDAKTHEFLCKQCCEGKEYQIFIGRIEPIIQNAIKLLGINECIVGLYKCKEDIAANLDNEVNTATRMEKIIKKELNTKEKQVLCIQVMDALKKDKYMDKIGKTMNIELEKAAGKIKAELKAYNEKTLEVIVKRKIVVNFSTVVKQNEMEIEKYEKNRNTEKIVKAPISSSNNEISN